MGITETLLLVSYYAMSAVSGFIHEVFSGIQGEGILVGYRQVFVRFSGCNLACCYCDTPDARSASPQYRVERTVGRRDFSVRQNPTSTTEVADDVVHLLSDENIHHSVSFTGGEPLVQSDFCFGLAKLIKDMGMRVYLETNGTLASDLTKLLPLVDFVAMDMKLPSATCGPNLFDAHESFLRLAAERNVFVKIALTSQTDVEDIEYAAYLIRSVDSAIPLVLQPVSPIGGVLPPEPSQLLDWQAVCLRILPHVRVIPQTHKQLGQL